MCLEMVRIWSMLLALILCLITDGNAASNPNIIFIVADDLGWNDVGFHNSAMITPNIDKLAAAGAILDQSYVQPVCSPTRTAIMTGRYPFKLGLQHLVIFNEQAVCVPLNEVFLPQKLKELSYRTHAVGKWHLGFCNWNCTPTYRGFDSFYGYYGAMEDHYSHNYNGGFDLRDNEKVVNDQAGNYSTDIFRKKAIDVINRHDQKYPLFLYLPFQAVHSPVEVPRKYEDLYPQISNEGRRKYCGMVTALDEAIGQVVAALKTKGLYNNSIIIFTTDNGGWVTEHGNNYPLRGGKLTVFEGGTRGVGFVHSNLLRKTGYRYEGLMHAVDWFPTVLSMAGKAQENPHTDGVDQWGSIREGLPSKRRELVYNLDNTFPPLEGQAAVRVGDYKLIQGFPGLYMGWYKPERNAENDTIGTLFSKDIYSLYSPYAKDLMRGKDGNSLTSFMNKRKSGDFPFSTQSLYDLKDDPNERKDIANKRPDIVRMLTARLEIHKKQMVPATFPFPSPESLPFRHSGIWSPGWC